MPKLKEKKVKLGAVKKPVEKKKPYHLEISVNDVVFKTNAKDLETALTEFVASPDFPVGAKTTAFVKYSKGKNERSKVWHTPEARRVFRLIGFKPDALKLLAYKWEQELA